MAPYTAVTAAIVGAVAEPTTRVPNPDQYETWRWIAFAVLVGATAAMVWRGKEKKSMTKRFPLLEVTVAMIAAIGWGLALPGSPLEPYLDGGPRSFVPLLVAFGTIALIAALGGKLTSKAAD